MRQRNKLRTIQRGAAVALLALSLFSTASFSQGTEPSARQFDIPAQSLSSALNEFARQSRQQILFAPSVVSSKISSPLKGEMQPSPALEILLKDSGLVYRATSSGVILVGDAHELGADTADTDAARTKSPSSLKSIIVEGNRSSAAIEREARSYVWGITTRPFPDVVARWDRPICPLVGGLSHDEGKYVLARLSRIATAAGARMAAQHCKPNFYVIASSMPNELMEEWSKQDPTMWDSHPKAEVHQFLQATGPIRAFYNPGEWWGGCRGQGFFRYPSCDDSDPIQHGALASVIVLIDARIAKNINFAQLTAYIAMAGLAQIRLDADLGNTSTILQLFADPKKAPPFGMSHWDRAYLKVLYHSGVGDRPAIARLLAQELAP